jgi:PAS domain S-box-containing protein
LSRWFDVFAFRIGDPESRKVAVLFTDITERRRAEAALHLREEQLRQSEERLRIALETAELGTWAYNPGIGELSTDARMREIFGLPAGAALSYDTFISAIHLQDRERVHALLQRVLRRDNIERYHEEYRITETRGGVDRWVRDAGRLYLDEARGTIQLVGTVLDISDLVQARELLARRGEELERTVKERTTQLRETVQQLETFSYSVVHDMRAPLRSVRSFANILDEEYSAQLDATARGYLHRIQGSVERMDSLITDVLTYSRVTSTEAALTRVDVDKLVHEIVEQYPQFQEFAGSVTIHSPLPAVLGNRALLTQCISNLLGTAVKFTPPGRKPEVVIRAETKEETVRLWFEDNGIGIRPEYRDRIFGLFQRLHRADQYPGTGVGLAVVQKAVERMRGTVGFESEFGRGSRFWIELLAPGRQA